MSNILLVYVQFCRYNSLAIAFIHCFIFTVSCCSSAFPVERNSTMLFCPFSQTLFHAFNSWRLYPKMARHRHKHKHRARSKMAQQQLERIVVEIIPNRKPNRNWARRTKGQKKSRKQAKMTRIWYFGHFFPAQLM